jgi:hypothetical protein
MSPEIILSNIACGVIGGLVVAFASHFLSRQRESEGRSIAAANDFRIFILHKIAAIPHRDFPHFYRLIKPEIELRSKESCVKLESRKVAIEKALAAFNGIDENTLDDHNEKDAWNASFNDRFDIKTPEFPSDILKRALNNLSDSVL